MSSYFTNNSTIKYLHDHLYLDANPEKTAGENTIENIVNGIIFVPKIMLIGIFSVLSLPFIGIAYIVDSSVNLNNVINHEEKLETDWQYRLNKKGIHINQLRKWESPALRNSNQYIRAIIHIMEAEDIPIEIWYFLLDDGMCGEGKKGEERVDWLGGMKMVGTDRYTSNIKKYYILEAMRTFIMKHSELTHKTYYKAIDELFDLIQVNDFHVIWYGYIEILNNWENIETKKISEIQPVFDSDEDYENIDSKSV